MLEKRVELKTSELISLLSWLKGETVILNKKFNFDILLNRCATEDVNDMVDVDGFFDDLMCDLYIIYEKLKKLTREELENKMIESPLFNLFPKDMIDQSMKSLNSFLDLYERLMITSKFEFPQIRGIQKNMMTEFISKYVMNEEYEKCIVLKENLKEV